MRFDIRYRTLFAYDAPVRESMNELRACPTSNARQQLLAYRLTTAPGARALPYTDAWGTRVDHFGVREDHTALEVVAEAAVETVDRPVPAAGPGLRCGELAGPARERLSEYLEATPHVAWGAGVESVVGEVVAGFGADPPVIELASALHERAHGALTYEPGVTEIGIEVEELLALGRGVCQDFAHLAVALCRAAGVPSRYVSGYLFSTDDATGDLTDADGRPARVVSVQTHAWTEVAVAPGEWRSFDPTNGLDVGPRHVKIGHGRDYDDVPPLRGVYAGSSVPEVTASVEMRHMDPAHPPVMVDDSVIHATTVRVDRAGSAQDQLQQQQ